MSPLKTIIADAVSRYPLETSPEWAGVRSGAAGDAEIERIEADGATIHTVDCLFDGEATVYLTDRSALHAQVFGRCDGRRARVERMLFVS